MSNPRGGHMPPPRSTADDRPVIQYGTSGVLPSDVQWQCPLCGMPIMGSVVRTAQAPTGEKGVVFACCDSLVTYAALRDAFGIDVPEAHA